MRSFAKKRPELSSYIAKGLLLASGLLAAGIAAAILFAPETLYNGYGIDIGSNVNLASELKAPAGLLLIAGLLMLAGAFRAALTVPALAMAAVLYFSYGASRVLSMTIDGVPNSALVTAAALEVTIGVACAFALTLR